MMIASRSTHRNAKSGRAGQRCRVSACRVSLVGRGTGCAGRPSGVKGPRPTGPPNLSREVGVLWHVDVRAIETVRQNQVVLVRHEVGSGSHANSPSGARDAAGVSGTGCPWTPAPPAKYAGARSHQIPVM